MNIVLFVHCFFPESFYGTETYTLELAQNLRALGHEATVVTAVFSGQPERGALVTRYEYAGVPVIAIDKNYLPHRNFRETYYQASMRPVLADLLDELRPDIVHVTHLSNHTVVLLDIMSERGLLAVATLTDFFGICHTSRLEAADGSLCTGPAADSNNCLTCALLQTGAHRPHHPLYRWLARPQIAARTARGLMRWHPGWLGEAVADIVDRPALMRTRYSSYRAAIAPTEFLATTYRRNGLEVPLHCMHFGVDIDRTAKVAPAVETPLRLGFIGQLAPHKGPDLLIAALRELPLGTATLTIYGSSTDPAYEASLRRAAAGLQVHFAGTFENTAMASVLAEFDCLAIPSRWYENSPLVLLNALASHTPVLVSDVPGMTEFVMHGVNGYVFPRGELAALSALLRRLAADPEHVRALFAKTDYPRTSRTMTEDVLALYKSICDHV